MPPKLERNRRWSRRLVGAAATTSAASLAILGGGLSAAGAAPGSSVPAVADPVAAPLPPALTCQVDVAPTDSLTGVVQGAPPATTFCLAPGTYTLTAPIVAKTGDAFVGQADARPVLDAGQTVVGIDAHRAGRVTLENLVVENARLSTSGPCNSCGRGVWGGDGLRAWDVMLLGNAQNGLSGTSDTTTAPWLIVGSQIVGNGSASELGHSSGGIKGTNAYTILNSYVSDNIGQGIWCDVGCTNGTWTVEGNTVLGNTQGGVRYEISDSGAVITGNLVEDNNTSNVPGLGGIEIASSGNALVQDNTAIGNGRAEIRISAGGRRGSVVVDDVIEDNAVAGGRVVGCTLSGVICTGNV